MVAAPLGIHTNTITGFYEVQAALKELDKNAARRMDKAINKAAEVVAVNARELVVGDVLSGFARQLPGGREGTRRRAYGMGYDDPLVRRGIKVKRRKQKKFGSQSRSFVVIANTTPLGAIWEVAGRRSGGTTRAGAAMIRNIRARDGAPSRTVWRAAEQTDMGHVEQEIVNEIDKARALVQSMIDKA